jgi:hypothetical protein
LHSVTLHDTRPVECHPGLKFAGSSEFQVNPAGPTHRVKRQVEADFGSLSDNFGTNTRAASLTVTHDTTEFLCKHYLSGTNDSETAAALNVSHVTTSATEVDECLLSMTFQ